MITLTKPEEILAAPGQDEAAAIRADYQTTMEGLHGFVRMGLRLMDVKARLPHGQYMAWCRTHLSDLGKSHLHNSRRIAEGLCEMTNFKFPPRWTFEELPGEITEIITGKTGYRALLGEIEEFRHDDLEATNKAQCEMLWKNEQLRDTWEPRVLSGELTYTKALLGMTGAETTGGKERGEDNTIGLLRRNIASLPNCWKKWETLTPQAKADTLANIGNVVDGAPKVVLQQLQAAIEKAMSA